MLSPHPGFMGELVPPNRKALAVYPLCLFYTSIGWLILIAAKRGWRQGPVVGNAATMLP